jgi:hypothetical protein
MDLLQKKKLFRTPRIPPKTVFALPSNLNNPNANAAQFQNFSDLVDADISQDTMIEA